MSRSDRLRELSVFSTSPQSKDHPPQDYARHVIDVAHWSEEFGCTGILVYTDNGITDPWLVSQLIVEHTESIRPLVAVQPVYMHPFTAAKMISTIGFLHGRAVALNMLAGGFKNDLIALDDNTPHDDRYLRTVEYTTILTRLLEDDAPVTFEGHYYRVDNLKLKPPLPAELMPDILISGSSAAGMQAAREIGATAVRYPRPAQEELAKPPPGDVACGIRVGIIAREHDDDAWAVAHDRFPDDRKGQLTHQLAMKTTDSQWHKQLATADDEAGKSPYWLGPFRNYQTFCPQLVGSYERTAAEIARYVDSGFRTFILDIPPSRDELDHTRIAFERALGATGA